MCEQLQPQDPMRYLPLRDGLFQTPPKGALLTLGCFDGLHPGHRALILNARRLAKEQGMPLGVWSPAGAKRTGELMPLYDKLQVLKELGVDFYIEEPFLKLRDLSPEEFFESFLLGCYGVRALACGENFTFGKGGAGTSETLAALCAQAGILLLVQELEKEEGEVISSARVRGALSEGDLAKAEKLLGAPYGFSAVVIHGRKVGRSLGFPTANLPLPKDCPLKKGVYTVEVHLEGQDFPALANVGVHPTFESASEPLCEAFLLKDPACSLYDKRVHITFLKFLRPERRFESPEELKAQIEKDLQYARGFFEK
ncbi:MAG: riboflavin biosynthesis protein RibF, partial [Clostridia bacterium]|nr:riboflavin biosynthesis protein RibF [Clostridia bacterium]